MHGRRLAVIPARGGSKRIPRKNIRQLLNKPMLAYSVEAALNSGVFERVIVSTDDLEVARVAEEYGAEVPFLRSQELADDFTPVSMVTIDTLKWTEANGQDFQFVAQLLPNCPLRNAEDVRDSFDAFAESGADFQLSVTAYGWLNPWWAMKLGAEREIEPLFGHALKARSQDLATLYCPTGSIWWARSAALIREGTFYGPDTRGFPLPWQHSVDIDEETDFQMAELLLARA